MPCCYCCVITFLKYLRVFNVHLEESCYGFIILKHKTMLFSFIAYLGGHGACLHHVLTMISRLFPLCACSLILLISLDALINNVLHPCMSISAIALLVWSLPIFC